MTRIGSFLFVFLYCFSVFAADDVKAIINGELKKEYEIGMGQSFTYSIVVSTGDGSGMGEPRLPDITGFNLMGRSSQVESHSQFVNGAFTFVRKQIFNYRLAPQAPGKYLFTPAEVVLGSGTVRSNSLQINVVKSAGNVRPSQPQNPNNPTDEQDAQPGAEPDDMMDQADAIFNQLLQRNLPNAEKVPDINPNEAFFVRAEVDRQKVYAGEQVTASWYLYTKNNLTNFEPMKYPDLKGFWKEDIEIATRLNFTNVEVGGVPYKKALLLSYALFPIKAGPATIDSLKLKATAIMTNPFGLFGKPYTFTKSSAVAKVDVLPIPTANQPKDFTGAVGNFEMKATVDKSIVPINEPFTFRVRFEGRGNGKQIELPALNLPEALEQYDTKNDSKFSKDGTSFKEFEILLIPRKTGDVQIPALSVSFFNPSTGKFDHKSSAPITVKVVASKSAVPQNQSGDFLQGNTTTPQKLSLPDLAYQTPSLTINQNILNRIWLGMTALVLLSLMLIYRREMKMGDTKILLMKEFQKRLAIINRLQNEDKLREAAVAVMNLVDFVLQEMTSETESHQLSELLEKLPPSVSEVLGDEFKSKLNYFETLGFAPDEVTKGLKDAKRFKSELKTLKQKLTDAFESFQAAQK